MHHGPTGLPARVQASTSGQHRSSAQLNRAGLAPARLPQRASKICRRPMGECASAFVLVRMLVCLCPHALGDCVGGTFKHTMASNETERMIIKSAARKEDRVCMNAAC